MISLVVFLGNCGKKYTKNRHNAAWLFADSLDVLKPLSWQKKCNGVYAVLDGHHPTKIYFLKPQTFMNLSGESAAPFADFFKITPEKMLIVHDDLELSAGTASLKWSGGLGGHNGLRSLKSQFGTADFWRLRLGIGRPDSRPETSSMDVASYVLSDFSADERMSLEQIFVPLGDFFNRLLNEEPQSFLPEWSKKKLL